MSTWKLPLLIIALVGVGIFFSMVGLTGSRSDYVVVFPLSGMTFMGALFLYKTWNRKFEKIH